MAGKILKFIGDGCSPFFRSASQGLRNLLHAWPKPVRPWFALNEKNGETGRAPAELRASGFTSETSCTAISGRRTRLDFTVIGPAVNMASRLEALTNNCCQGQRDGGYVVVRGHVADPFSFGRSECAECATHPNIAVRGFTPLDVVGRRPDIPSPIPDCLLRSQAYEPRPPNHPDPRQRRPHI